MRRKWELIEEDVHGRKQNIDSIFGIINNIPCRYDVYRKKRWNGIYKYKKIER